MQENNVGLGNFLNEVTANSELREEKIIYIDIDNLESNPKNFYGLRDVDSLAGLISVSHLIEPLTVSEKADGKYQIISGHRRRAAVQKLLDDGVYNERKLPCIVKKCKKIQIEQENGETIEFDEDAVEMLNLIASNRGQREERTIDEKLQEVKYLERFAKAIYNQKSRGTRGRFVNFFAEEILNISKSQLLRINSLEKLSEEVRAAVDDKKISETAAMEMATMTAEEQDACLEKILTGEIKGTVQDIQDFKSSKAEASEESPENSVEEILDNVGEPAVEQKSEVIESVPEENSAENENITKSEVKLTYPKKLLPTSEKNLVSKIIDVPEEFGESKIRYTVQVRREVGEMKEKAIIFLILCVAVRLVFEGLSEIFYLNVTSSLPQGLYMKIPSKEFSRGDYIIYEPTEEVKAIIIKNGWGNGEHNFLKKVGAVSGEKYSINADTLIFEIEGKYIGKVFEKDNVGHELPKLRGKFEVPKDCVLPIATSERSFDGRYSGAISKKQIKARVIPIFTL